MLNSHVNRVPLSRTGRLATLVGLLGVTAIVAGFRADAQTFASLSGSVLDPQTRGIPAVTVSLTNMGNQAKHEVRSDDLGQFEFVGVPPGQYQLEAAVPGFQTFRSTMALQPRRARQDIAMKVGSLTETVTIQGSSTPGARAESPKPRSVDTLAADRTIAACTPSGAGGQIRPPTKIGNVNPVYPDPDGKLEGIVVLEGRVATDGSVTQAKVLRSPYVELERAALEAFEQWQFTPTLLNCVPIEVTITATMAFSVKP
jgi:TonB family protein